MQIPAFNKSTDADSGVTDSSPLKPLPSLAAVHIKNSRFALCLYHCSYGVFALSLLLVFYPYIIDNFLWIFGLIFCWASLWRVYRREITARPTGVLSFSEDRWLFDQDGCTCQLALAGEVLCWSWLIVLPLLDTTTGKSRRLLVFNDALNKHDNARLRRWLRACLTPKA